MINVKLFVFSRESDFLRVIYFIHYVGVTITVFRPIQTEGQLPTVSVFEGVVSRGSCHR